MSATPKAPPAKAIFTFTHRETGAALPVTGLVWEAEDETFHFTLDAQVPEWCLQAGTMWDVSIHVTV